MQFFIDFNGKKIACFDIGKQVVYLDTFQECNGHSRRKNSGLGGETVGYWSTDAYEFTDSKAVCDGKFLDLVLDEANQSKLTNELIKTWLSQLKEEFGL